MGTLTLTVAQATRLRPEAFHRLGAFNVKLDEDSPLYVDPRLLHFAQTPELLGASAEVDEYFAKILYLLKSSAKRGDRLWATAERMLQFREPEGMHLGYGAGTRGAGIGPDLRDRIIVAAQESLALGYNDPRMLQFLILLEAGVGHDRISDMVCRIVYPRFLRYSETVFRQLAVEGKPHVYMDGQYVLPRSPIDGKPIVLVPREVVALLPRSGDEWGIERICKDAQELRDYFNNRLGKDWELRLNRREILKAFKAEPRLLEVAQRSFHETKPEPYDFESDGRGFQRPLDDAIFLAEANPVRLTLSANPSLAEARQLVMAICRAFKQAIEDKGGAPLLWDKSRPRNEKHVQRLFRVLAEQYCTANDLDISPESDAGRGPVDFKFSRGAKAKVLVELKLASNIRIEHGLRVQLPEYQKAEGAPAGIMVVVDFGMDAKVSKKLKVFLSAAAPDDSVLFVDGSIKKSASKFEPATAPTTKSSGEGGAAVAPAAATKSHR